CHTHPGDLPGLVEVFHLVDGSKRALDGRPCPIQVTLPGGQLGSKTARSFSRPGSASANARSWRRRLAVTERPRAICTGSPSTASLATVSVVGASERTLVHCSPRKRLRPRVAQ